MIVSKKWLQKYFDAPLPDTDAIVDAFTFHAFEVESVEEKGADTIIDVKVLPNRAPDCLGHRGVARELGAILDQEAKPDMLRTMLPPFPKTDAVSVSVEDARLCPRYMGALIRGVKVGPSPAWLREALESIGQRSINNVVDATNYVMFDLGQPLHAFDAARLMEKEGTYAIAVRAARTGEKITVLTGDDYELPQDTLAIVDAHADAPIGIAGIKGGKAAEITTETKDIVIESANFNGTAVRLSSQKLKLWTDAGKRFQNKISPELAAYGMKAVIDLILDIAGGELVGVTDVYPAPQETKQVPVSLTDINGLLGTEYSGRDVESVFHRLGLAYKKAAEDFTVDPPFERRDIVIPEDLIEEVGSIEGYDTVPPMPLPPLETAPNLSRFRGIERIKDFLIRNGFTELSTQSFAKEGAVYLANPLQLDRPALRDSLVGNMQEALVRATYDAPRTVGPTDAVRLFELGTIFKAESEHTSLAIAIHPLQKTKKDLVGEFTESLKAEFGMQYETRADEVVAYDLAGVDLETLGAGYVVTPIRGTSFVPFSPYPFITRDIAFWAPAGTEAADVEKTLRAEGTELMTHVDQFDHFEKEGRVSYGFRLVFESMERTLTDEEVNAVMEKVTAAITAAGYEVR